MIEENLLISKIDFEEDNIDKDSMEKERIRQRNNYYQNLISNSKDALPFALNAEGLLKIKSKEILEQDILKSDKHLSSLIPEYIITREFIFNLLKNYQLFDITEEESNFLLQKYFSDTSLLKNIDINDEDILDLSIKIEELDDQLDGQLDDQLDYQLDDLQSNKDETEDNKQTSTFLVIKEKKDVDNIESNINSTINISTIPSMATETFSKKKKNILENNNMSKEKIEETKEIKKNISLFFKNALQKQSTIDKKKTIIQFLHKNNFKVTFTASFFDIKDEYGEPLFPQDIINEWFDAIEQIEDKQQVAFECSQLLITVFLYGIEWGAKKIGIDELSTICSEIKDPSNLPKHIENTKQSLSNAIDSNIPNNFITNILFFIANVYIKNKAGITNLL